VKVGDAAEIVGLQDTKKRGDGDRDVPEVMDEAQAGDNVGILLRGIEKDQVERGQVICAPGTIQPHKKFKGQVYILNKEEGGRHTPFFSGYRPQFYVRTTDVTGSLKLKAGVEMVMPGDNVEVEVELLVPVALEKACGSPSAKAATPWAPASSRKSWRKRGDHGKRFDRRGDVRRRGAGDRGLDGRAHAGPFSVRVLGELR
jgi:hypothetical protein